MILPQLPKTRNLAAWNRRAGSIEIRLIADRGLRRIAEFDDLGQSHHRPDDQVGFG
jgi:hypothetical protein